MHQFPLCYKHNTTSLINVSCLACSTDNKFHNDKALASVHS